MIRVNFLFKLCFLFSGLKWHARRKLLSPTFHSELLKEYLKVAIKEVNVLTYCLQDEVGKAAFDIVPYTKRSALDVICSKYSKI